MSRRLILRGLSLSTILLASSLMVSSCVYPSKLPIRSKNIAGTEVQQRDLDLSFVQVGSTRRDEVRSRLAAIDTGYSDPTLFWGRWVSSSWGTVQGLGIIYQYDDNHRIWKNRNLLIRFDEGGTVSSKVEVDEKALCRELLRHVVQLPALNLSQPVIVNVGYFTRGHSRPAQMTLANDRLEFRKMDSRPSEIIRISPTKVTRISHSAGEGLDRVWQVLHFDAKTAFGKKVTFGADAPDFVTLLVYLKQKGRSDLAWD
jgi:hypothetical protein